MNNILRHIAIACIALLFTACTTDNSDLNDQPLMPVEYSSIPIAFTADDSNTQDMLTRGAQITTADLKSFAVNARYYTTSSQYGRDFFDAQKIEWGSDKWTYTPVKYWPTTGELDFYAYSPTQSEMKGTFESLNMPHNEAYVWLMHYSVKAPVITSITELSGNTITAAAFNKAKDAQNQQDLLLAVNTNNKCTEERGINSKVQLSFKHALAGIRFQLAAPVPPASAGGIVPDGATHVILSIAPMCAGGTIAMDTNGSITWTTDESEATYYQAYEIEAGSYALRAPDAEAGAEDNTTFFLPPQKLKNFTITARFYQKESDGTYTHLVTRTSNHTAIELKQGITQTLTLK